MLNYCKKILKSVSFDKELFEKELKKAVRNLLLNDEVMALRKWCLRKFSNSYKQIIEKVFSEFNSQQKLPV
ncbi:MAG: hypothetical protein KBB37_04385 [Bacteroidia bacterium]|nr:hypothetical protein [Bacteroidia bacterium]MBP7260504.1 hypothetical protein [Bacteroidia bacterium]MBP9179553.1 hypothetical protein [Bacteroidia bacterium]MBP9724031.1 hypothetical protein [Bacteroidia bacterium]